MLTYIYITVVITIVIIYDNYRYPYIYYIFTPPRRRCCCYFLSTNVCCVHVIDYVLIIIYNFIFLSYMYSTKTECVKFNYNTTAEKPSR